MDTHDALREAIAQELSRRARKAAAARWAKLDSEQRKKATRKASRAWSRQCRERREGLKTQD